MSAKSNRQIPGWHWGAEGVRKQGWAVGFLNVTFHLAWIERLEKGEGRKNRSGKEAWAGAGGESRDFLHVSMVRDGKGGCSCVNGWEMPLQGIYRRPAYGGEMQGRGCRGNWRDLVELEKGFPAWMRTWEVIGPVLIGGQNACGLAWSSCDW